MYWEGGAADLTFTINGVGDNNGTAAIPSFQYTRMVVFVMPKAVDVTIVENRWKYLGLGQNMHFMKIGYPNYNLMDL